MEMCKNIRELRIQRLETDLKNKEEIYNAVAEKKRRESNPEEEYNLELQLQSLDEKINKIKQKIRDLEDEAKDNKIKQLQKILNEFTKEEISIIKKAHRACSPEGWDSIATDKPEEILVDVLRMRPKHTRVESFVVSLIARLNNPSLVNKLNNWAEENINDFDELCNQTKTALAESHKKPYLIVCVRESSKKDYYFVDAWLITDADTYHYHDNPDCKQIHKSKEDFTWKEISCEINNFLNQIGEYSSSKLTIEIFLPLDLINEAVDSWESENEFGLKVKLNNEYNVVVRSTERLLPTYNRYTGFWQEKWTTLQDIIKNSVLNAFVLHQDDDLKKLFTELKKENKIGIKLQTTPIKTGKGSVFAVILSTAIPVALWLRCHLPNCNEQIDALLECCIYELIENVGKKRLEAFPKPQDSHIGHHISLLWEDPYRLPPGTYDLLSMPK
jgi:hypothetical protein